MSRSKSSLPPRLRPTGLRRTGLWYTGIRHTGLGRTASRADGVRAWLWCSLLVIGLSVVFSMPSAAQTSPAGTGPAVGVAAQRPAPEIKVIQPKTFFKARRLEITPFLGGEVIDPWVRHYVGGVSATYHMTEVFAIEGLIGYSPSIYGIGTALGFDQSQGAYDSDRTPLALELIYGDSAAMPTSSKIGGFGHIGMVFSPFYGKFAFFSRRFVNFDLYFMSGMGFLGTHDLDVDNSRNALTYATTDRLHLATNFGFGFRAAFNEWAALKLEGREYIHIEDYTFDDGFGNLSVGLSTKYYFMTQLGLSFFFP